MLRTLLRRFADVKKVVENEFYNNPHFARAFPHLASEMNEPEPPKPYTGWGESLQYKYKDEPSPLQDVESYNYGRFVEGYRMQTGPLKWMSDEDKNIIHDQINLKMDQLEQTGLSRQEILLNKPGGIPLSQDPVFQFLRRNKEAREMLVKPGEEFTAYKVIDYALKQDVGTDMAKILPNIGGVFEDELSPTYHIDLVTSKGYPEKIHPRDYYWKERFAEKIKQVNDYYGPSPLVYQAKIEAKGKTLRRNYRQISVKDINYKNTEFLCQFLTESGRLRNRFQTRLPAYLQRKISKAVTHARALGLLPNNGFILPPHKMGLIPLHAQPFQDFVIHSETGGVFARKYQGEVSRLNYIEHPNTIEKIAKRFKIENNNEDIETNLDRAKDLIDYQIQFFPSKTQIDIMESHKFLKKNEGEEGKEVADKLLENFKDQNSIEIIENFIKEKAVDTSIVRNN